MDGLSCRGMAAASKFVATEVVFRCAEPSDLPALARIHRAAYSAGHFTSVFAEDLLVDYYGRFLGDGAQIMLACAVAVASDSSREAGEIQGFAVFGRHIPERIAQFKSERSRAILATALRHPWLAVKKLASLVMAKSQPGASVKPAEVLLLSIAVRTPGHGVGGVLLSGLNRWVADTGGRAFGLYVNAENISAINAYVRVGFVFKELVAGQYYMESIVRPA